MASGGSRNRSGPAPDPRSGRSDRRGLSFDKLPASGHRLNCSCGGIDMPDFPLPKRWITTTSYIDGAKIVDDDEAATDQVAAREADLWAWAWKLPQACAWAQPSEGWRLYTIAMWVRTYVLCESADALAADKSSLHRFADQIGMTPAGLRENGWQIVRDELSQRAAANAVESEPTDEDAPVAPVRRLRG